MYALTLYTEIVPHILMWVTLQEKASDPAISIYRKKVQVQIYSMTPNGCVWVYIYRMCLKKS